MVHTILGALILLGNQPTLVVVIIGAVVIMLGLLRLLGRLPRMSLNLLGRPDTPRLSGILMMLVGGVAIVVALVRR
ncbi:MAG TPA: hypothetical protein VJR48_00705 [Ktedonobacterales bacterium]|nr:hypothetical protein [Ktedonobacterales bacterium]